MANERDTQADVERFPPTHQDAETREETVARALRDDPVQRSRASESQDPSERSRFGQKLTVRSHAWGLAGAVLGAVLGLLLALNATPVEAPFLTDRGDIGTFFGTVGYMLLLAAAFFVVFWALSGLVYTAREDGRTERIVEEDTGRGPQDPAQPLDPKHDV